MDQCSNSITNNNCKGFHDACQVLFGEKYPAKVRDWDDVLVCAEGRLNTSEIESIEGMRKVQNVWFGM